VIVVADHLLARHLAQALAGHCVRLRRDGQPVPVSVEQLLQGLRATLQDNPRQPPPMLAEVPRPADAHDVVRDSGSGLLEAGAGIGRGPSRRLSEIALSYAVAGELLGLSRRTVSRMVAAGELDAIGSGSGRRVTAESVRRLAG